MLGEKALTGVGSGRWFRSFVVAARVVQEEASHPRRTLAFFVRSIMSHPPHTADPDTTLAEAAAMLRAHHIRHLPVVDRAHHVVGILSQRDLVAAGVMGTRSEALVRQDTRTVSDVMKRTFHVIRAEEPVAKAGTMILNNGYGSLPVVHAGRLVGIVTATDFVRLVVDNIDRFGGTHEPRWRD
jgi:CBS domain-containing protein